MSKKEILLYFIEKNNGIVTNKDCKALGIPTNISDKTRERRHYLPS